MTEPTRNKIERTARLRWVSIAKMKINPLAQRDLNQARVDRLAADLDLERLGYPYVNQRDESFYVIDGQHRIAALKQHGWGDQQIECWTYAGLTEDEEAEAFLKLNDQLTVAALPKFRAAITAGRPDECDIDRIVRANGCVVTLDEVPGAIGAVGTIGRIYRRSGPTVLGRTVRIVRDAYGDSGFEAAVLDGIGMLCQRYNGDLEDATAVAKLGASHGGANGLLGKAETIRRSTGNAKSQCVAAAAVEIINSGKGGKKLPSWWKDAS